MKNTCDIHCTCLNLFYNLFDIIIQKKDQLKLFHVSTGSVFSNWPTDKTPLGVVTCMDFSAGGAYFGFGNKRGNVLLYRLKQYDEV